MSGEKYVTIEYTLDQRQRDEDAQRALVANRRAAVEAVLREVSAGLASSEVGSFATDAESARLVTLRGELDRILSVIDGESAKFASDKAAEIRSEAVRIRTAAAYRQSLVKQTKRLEEWLCRSSEATLFGADRQSIARRLQGFDHQIRGATPGSESAARVEAELDEIEHLIRHLERRISVHHRLVTYWESIRRLPWAAGLEIEGALRTLQMQKDGSPDAVFRAFLDRSEAIYRERCRADATAQAERSEREAEERLSLWRSLEAARGQVDALDGTADVCAIELDGLGNRLANAAAAIAARQPSRAVELIRAVTKDAQALPAQAAERRRARIAASATERVALRFQVVKCERLAERLAEVTPDPSERTASTLLTRELARLQQDAERLQDERYFSPSDAERLAADVADLEAHVHGAIAGACVRRELRQIADTYGYRLGRMSPAVTLGGKPRTIELEAADGGEPLIFDVSLCASGRLEFHKPDGSHGAACQAFLEFADRVSQALGRPALLADEHGRRDLQEALAELEGIDEAANTRRTRKPAALEI